MSLALLVHVDVVGVGIADEVAEGCKVRLWVHHGGPSPCCEAATFWTILERRVELDFGLILQVDRLEQVVDQLVAEVDDLGVAFESLQDCQHDVQRYPCEKNILSSDVADDFEDLDCRFDRKLRMDGHHFEELEIGGI